MKTHSFYALVLLFFPVWMGSAAAKEKPNILWLTSEDHGPQMGCYGDKLARTPFVDGLAKKGMRYRTVWSCAPVCAPARTTIITGVYPTALGAEHMRSELPMPVGLRMFPQYLRDAGYFCSNNSKEDYNLVKPGQVWDESSNRAHYRNRGKGQPFFAVFNSTVSHESQVRKRPHQLFTDASSVRVPAYHPDTPEVRADWAQYYDQVSQADAAAGKHLVDLEKAGLSSDTIVFYFADHGPGMPRCKRWPCHSGLSAPLVVYFPEKWKHLAPADYQVGGESARLISFVNLAPTILSLAGIQPPPTMQGTAFAGPFSGAKPSFVFGFRGRMDERVDLVRSVTDGRFVYIRNFMPQLSQGQHVAYQFETPTTRIWKKLYDQGSLNPAQKRFWETPKPIEELYDLNEDPDEVRNLASLPTAQIHLDRFRKALDQHIIAIRDTGFLPEAEMHRRREGGSPRDRLGTDASFPLGAIYQAAKDCTQSAVPWNVLNEALSSREPAIRYWGVQGVLQKEGLAFFKTQMVDGLTDSNPSVRVACAEALALQGEKDEWKKALTVLQAESDPTRTGVYQAVAALGVIDRLGKKAMPLKAWLEKMPTQDPQASGRVKEYVSRLRENALKHLSD